MGFSQVKCFNLNSKKTQANIYLVDAQEVDLLQSFSQFQSATQNITGNCPSVGDNSDSYSISHVSFFVCEIQEQAIVSSPKQDLIQIWVCLPVFIANLSTSGVDWILQWILMLCQSVYSKIVS